MDEVAQAVAAAVHRLADLAHPGGTWTDFWLEPGASSSWVTAVAGHALAVAALDDRLDDALRELADRTAGRAADALLRTTRDGAWGWSPAVRPDADSTAWAARTLCATDRPVDDRTWAFLEGHRTGAGYGTYRARAAGTWTEPTPDVTAAVLLALHEGGRLTSTGLAARWVEWFGDAGRWPSHWWHSEHQSGALVLEAWSVAGRPGVPPSGHEAALTSDGPRPDRLPSDALTSDGLASALWAAALRGDPPRVDALLARLLAAQLADGGWPGLSVLTVPPAHPGDQAARTHDARGIFTTATAVHALLALPTRPRTRVDRRAEQASPERRRHRRLATPAGSRSTDAPAQHTRTRDARWDALIAAAARSQGCDPELAVGVLTELTRESFAHPSPWPAEQLSTLAAGLPLELSASGTPGLRFACEVGDPRLPPHRRVRTGLAALARTAAVVGVDASWRACAPVLDLLADPVLPVPDGTRFWVWAGLDLHPGQGPVLKAYVSMHPREVPGWRERERLSLLAAGVPAGTQVFAALDRLAADGWCQQIGIGLAPDGRRGLKVYYELTGWRPALIRDLVALCDLPDAVDALTPQVPGVLRAELAARQRAGISLRVDLTGRVDEVTVTAAFPPPLVGRDELDRRVLSWLPRTGTDAEPLAALLRVVAPTWLGGPPLARRLSLFTRSLRADRAVTTVYVRPGPAPHRAGEASGSREPQLLTGR